MATRQQWDYQIVQDLDEESLNALGRQRWELVAVSGDSPARFYLKRLAPDFREQVTLDQKERYFGEWGVDSEGASS